MWDGVCLTGQTMEPLRRGHWWHRCRSHPKSFCQRLTIAFTRQKWQSIIAMGSRHLSILPTREIQAILMDGGFHHGISGLTKDLLSWWLRIIAQASSGSWWSGALISLRDCAGLVLRAVGCRAEKMKQNSGTFLVNINTKIYDEALELKLTYTHKKRLL